jgi:hypothetical protein
MTTTHRIENVLAMFVLGCGMIACTTQAAKSDAGGGSGGHAGNGGSSGGSGGSGGGAGGSGGVQYATPDGTTCLAPASSGLITNFTYTAADGGATDQVHFGDDATTLSGGEFFYPNDPATNAHALMSVVTGSNWHISGTVGDFSGFGFYFDNCNRVDASAFRGISFDIGGTVTGNISFEVDTLNDTIPGSWIMAHAVPGQATATDPGHCIPNAAAANQFAQTDCVEPTIPITVSSVPTTVMVLWNQFTTGKPEMLVAPNAPKDIIGIRWVLPTPTGAGTDAAATYPLDITVDNIAFIP